MNTSINITATGILRIGKITAPPMQPHRTTITSPDTYFTIPTIINTAQSWLQKLLLNTQTHDYSHLKSQITQDLDLVQTTIDTLSKEYQPTSTPTPQGHHLHHIIRQILKTETPENLSKPFNDLTQKQKNKLNSLAAQLQHLIQQP